MDKKSKEALRKYKKSRQAQSSSSDSSDDSGSSSSYSSDKERRKKKARLAAASRRSSSSGDERKKRDKRDYQQLLEAKRLQIKRKLKEAKLKKRAAAAAAALSGHSHRPLSPGTQAKIKKLAERKHQRAASKERREREREKLRAEAREREHHRVGSRSPTKITKIRIHQDVKAARAKSPPRMHHQLMTREKIIIQTRTRDRTPSAERERQRHEHKMRHADDLRDRDRRDRDRERAEREAARDKERAEALARCQERQRERERLAREKLRREEEDKKYGSAGVREERLLSSREREHVLASSSSSRVYGSRERSLDLISKREREVELYEREREFLEAERRGLLDREELRREREYLAARRRELSPVVEHYGSRLRDPRDLYPEEERERVYRERAYLEEARHPRDREAWLEARELRDREVHEARELRDYREIDRELLYPEERVERGGGRSEWNIARERDWDEPPVRGSSGFIGGPKRPPSSSLAVSSAKMPRDQRPPSDPDWDDLKAAGSGVAGVSGVSKAEAVHLREDVRGGAPYSSSARDSWMEHDQRDLPSGSGGSQRDKGPPPERRWQPEWRDPEPELRSASHLPPLHHRVARGFRRAVPPGPPVEHLERPPASAGPPPPSGSSYSRQPHQPPPLMTLPVQPPPNQFHGTATPRFGGKRNMTYTNPTIIKKQQAAAAAAKAAAQASAATVVAAVKAAAHSVATATTNPGILGQVGGAAANQMASPGGSDKPEAGEILAEGDSSTQPGDEEPESGPNGGSGSGTGGAASVAAKLMDKGDGGELSEISDSEDEILNNPEKKSEDDLKPEPAAEVAAEAVTPASEVNPSNPFASDPKPLGSLDSGSGGTPAEELVPAAETPAEDDEMLDFEEISDGELEEEARNKGVGDALGVDWASLIAETKKQAAASASTQANDQPTSHKQKWQPHRILLDIGISMEMAGPELAKALLSEAQRKLDQELDEMRPKPEIKEEVDDELQAPAQNGAGGEPLSQAVVTSTTVDNLHPLACIQVVQRLRQQQQRKLVATACGPNSRALSARQDLKLRRQLCGLPAKESNIPRPVPPTSSKLKALAMQAFQRVLEVK